MENNIPQVQECTDTSVGKKEYIKPELTEFGSIADLVKANGGVGTDGGAFPPVTLT